MSKAIYSKSLGISSDDVAKCENPFQLKEWYLQVYRDCLNIKEGIDFVKKDPAQQEVLFKRKAALRSQIQLLKEIAIRHNEAKHGIFPIIKEIVAFYEAANKLLPADTLDWINTEAMKTMKLIPI